MIIKVNFTYFCDAFRKMGRNDQFSYSGKRALFDFIESSENESEQTELDVIALCCDFAEFETALDAALEFGFNGESEKDALEWLNDRTTVIRFDGGVIIQNF